MGQRKSKISDPGVVKGEKFRRTQCAWEPRGVSRRRARFLRTGPWGSCYNSEIQGNPEEEKVSRK
ncbi:hypothetical protein Nmel_006968 [Mimus melanotis]